MVKILHVAGGTLQTGGFSHTGFQPVVGSLTQEAISEAAMAVTMRFGATVSLLWIRIPTNTASSTDTLTFRKNAANGNETISIAAGTTGTFQDTTHTDSVSPGDAIDYALSGSGITEGSIAAIYHSRSGQSGACHGAYNVIGNFGTTPIYTWLDGQLYTGTCAESQARWPIRFAMNWSNLATYIYSSSTTSANTITSRKNGANGNQTISIGAGATGEFEDTTHSDSVASGDTIDIQVLNPSATTFEPIRMNSVLSPTSSWLVFQLGGYLMFPSATTRYAPPMGPIGGFSLSPAEGSVEQTIFGPDLTVEDLFVNIALNSINGTTTVTTRKNAANGNMSVSVAASTSGTFEDLTHSVSLTTGDNYDMQLVIGGSSGSLFTYTWGTSAIPASPINHYTAILSDNALAFDRSQRQVRYQRRHAETPLLSDRVSRRVQYRRIFKDATLVIDRVTTQYTKLVHHFYVTIRDTTLILDRVTRRVTYSRRYRNAVLVLDRISRSTRHSRTFGDSVIIADRVTRAAGYARRLLDAVYVVDRVSTAYKKFFHHYYVLVREVIVVEDKVVTFTKKVVRAVGRFFAYFSTRHEDYSQRPGGRRI